MAFSGSGWPFNASSSNSWCGEVCDTGGSATNGVFKGRRNNLAWHHGNEEKTWWHHQNGNALCYWPFVRGIHQDSPHKGQWCRALFSLIRTWTNCWANNRDTSDLKCHHAHYDITVMSIKWSSWRADLWNVLVHNKLFIYMIHTNCLKQYFEFHYISLCNHVILYGLASPRLLHSLDDHIKSSHSFKHGCNNGRWVVLYALVSPQWSHAWFWGRVRTILFPVTKLCSCVYKLGGSV